MLGRIVGRGWAAAGGKPRTAAASPRPKSVKQGRSADMIRASLWAIPFGRIRTPRAGGAAEARQATLDAAPFVTYTSPSPLPYSEDMLMAMPAIGAGKLGAALTQKPQGRGV